MKRSGPDADVLPHSPVALTSFSGTGTLLLQGNGSLVLTGNSSAFGESTELASGLLKLGDADTPAAPLGSNYARTAQRSQHARVSPMIRAPRS
jgi:hypothetical protein